MPDFLAEVLTWSENYYIALAIETALELKLPPLGFIRMDDDASPVWSGLDKKLAVAFKIMEKEVCGSCNQPIWICRNTSNDIDFSIRVDTCYSKKAMEEAEKKRSRMRDGKLKPGQYLYSVPVTASGDELPRGLRKAYFENLSEE